MKFETPMRRALAVILAASLTACAYAADKKDKTKPAANQVVDSGSFGIFVKGARVATETFHIEQQNGATLIKSQLKETSGGDSTSQKSDLEMTPSGDLLRYEWSQSSGGSLSVFPDNEFLKEKITAPGATKPAEQAFLLPASTPILDNNFFVQREVLAWKYLQIAPCKDEKDKEGKDHRHCEPQDFGTLVPQDHFSMPVRMELVGKEKVMIRGVERELLRLNLRGEGLDWALWLDDQDKFKLIKVGIPSENTEVVRD
ncbi:MAG: hypothetical protein WAN60_07275 [Candidatus Sulfotelmatobacter sp.]